ncbi:C2 domain-containing protein [Endogone sp. FLAS-F59071]|nr:C2 domain-containing protein [Endogone sp. FLAS-F59071]|eukprot:RUS14952.1 C2 domain-containing protein [Endogone sp. FLAS-F59071]
MSEILGNIEVTIIEARNLKDADWFSKNDPWCELTVDGVYKQKTKYINNTSLPDWNETFTFPILAGQNKLYITLYDKDWLTSDKLGQVTLDLFPVFQQNRLHEWIPLDKDPGELHLFVRWISAAKLEEAQ